ncbi:alpha/beta fold hydrolase [Streptomyces griseocarneus]|uniref:alpha/beta fold hydrolase n=1 Tax=Streptomyces griseocarneus TaxID=51201 RepID=UPI001992D41D|nr:alpha/beta fold hydrolase [Streptomyces griseocarneus]MBZ6475264.1 alpha/beta fold hydrolase [Streptomyces griseocarneus]GHG61361.1 hydrolase [Streptomyces griseocarneus]
MAAMSETATVGRMVEVGGIELWTEEFGDPSHPPVLLISGSMSQGLLWPDEFVGRLAAAGHRVVRYDHRDVGRSTARDFEQHPYTWADLKEDAVGLMDALGIGPAHLVGHSAGGLIAQWIAADHPGRVESLTVIGSSPLGAREGEVLIRALMGQPQPEGSLPEPAVEFVEFFQKAAAGPQPATRAEIVDFQIELARVLHGGAWPSGFDEDAQRRLEERLFDRMRAPRTAANHRLAGMADLEFEPQGALARVTAPTLVVEGTAEPVKPGHGRLIAQAIAGARLVMVPGMGHMLTPDAVEPVANALVAHLEASAGGCGA